MGLCFKDFCVKKMCKRVQEKKLHKGLQKVFLYLYWKHDLHFLSGFTSHLLACTWVQGQLESHLHTLGLAHLEFGQPLLWWYSQTRKTEGQCEGQRLREKCGEQGPINTYTRRKWEMGSVSFYKFVCLAGKSLPFYFCVLTRAMWSQWDNNQESNLCAKHFRMNVLNSTS